VAYFENLRCVSLRSSAARRLMWSKRNAAIRRVEIRTPPQEAMRNTDQTRIEGIVNWSAEPFLHAPNPCYAVGVP
jgi:hypothetical protein